MTKEETLSWAFGKGYKEATKNERLHKNNSNNSDICVVRNTGKKLYRLKFGPKTFHISSRINKKNVLEDVGLWVDIVKVQYKDLAVNTVSGSLFTISNITA